MKNFRHLNDVELHDLLTYVGLQEGETQQRLYFSENTIEGFCCWSIHTFQKIYISFSIALFVSFLFLDNFYYCKAKGLHFKSYLVIQHSFLDQLLAWNWVTCMNLPSSYAYRKMHIDITGKIDSSYSWFFGVCILHYYKKH